MALIKDVPTEFGDDDFASYWNVGEVHDDIRNSNLRAVFFGYRNRAARESNRSPKSAANINIAGADYKKGLSIADIYAFVKAQTDSPLAGATDD
jgi:hypothetical protein